MTIQPPNWFDVNAMIDQSVPSPRAKWWRWMAVSMLVGLLFATLTAGGNPAAQLALRILTGAVLLAFMAILVSLAWSANRAARNERQQIDQLEEMVTLRQWPAAAMSLHALLLRPMLNHGARIQALMYLSSVLGRYHRFTDALDVHNYLLNHFELDGNTVFNIRVGRVMAMLREDHLVDADRAISELRRMNGATETAAYALVQLFRDVKTGHAAEATELFEKRRALFAAQLGHRAADAFLLAAQAYLSRGDRESADRCFHDATLLAPTMELKRRYPETAALFEAFEPAAAPLEAR